MIELRITSGIFKGRTIKVPKRKDETVAQYTKEMVRKAIFDIVGERIRGAVFLDLFSGSGAIGFEAYSRGAREVVLVENDPDCRKAVEQSCQKLFKGASNPGFFYMPYEVFKAIKMLGAKEKKFSLIFIDPPYGRPDMVKKVLIKILDYAILDAQCLVIVEHASRDTMPEAVAHGSKRLRLFRPRTYGNTTLSFYVYEEST